MRTIRNISAYLLCLFAVFSSSVFAQSNYPNKPINLIVPYGAGGNISTEAIVRAAPDGYTIGMGNFAPMAVNKTLFGNLRYDLETDLTPIILVEKGPLVLVVNPNSPFKTVQDIVVAAKAKPGVLTFSSGGIGESHQLSAELFELNADIQMIHVPYKSGSAALTDLMAGNVDLMFDQMYSAVPSIKADKIRPLAITSKKRSPLLPNVPSFVELGYPKVEVLNWQGLIAPKGTPKAIIDKLNAAANEALKDLQLRELMLAQGNEIGGGSPAEFAALVKSEASKWSAVVKSANIKPE